MKRPMIVGVMGGGRATAPDLRAAYELGRLIADRGWILLNGGRNAGIMEASARGASENGGMTLGIVPDDHPGQVSEFIQIPVLTGMGSARNNINVLTSDVVVACPGGTGTLSEVALALKSNKPIILLNFDILPLMKLFSEGGDLHAVDTPAAAVEIISRYVEK